MHIEERMSYRVISKSVKERWGYRVSPKSLCSMVNAVAGLSKSSVEIQQEYRPCWSGYLTVDDKWISVKGTRHLSLVAVDNSGDPLHSELHTESDQGVYDGFFLYLRDRLGYRLRALTTDFDPRLAKAARRVFGADITHQKCLWHATEIVKALIEYPQAQLERRLKTIEAFQSIKTAFQYQNLYRNYLHLKPYTDCRGERRVCNGLSPLQVCKAVLPSSDWLKLAVRYPK